MPENSYPKLFCQEWNVKPHRGRQRKTWEKVIDDIFLSLRLDKCEWLEDMKEKPDKYEELAVDMAVQQRGYKESE